MTDKKKNDPIHLDRADIEAELMAMSRAPFRDALANLLSSEPSVEAVRAFAQKYPDRWSQAVSMMARLTGFDQRLQLDANVYSQVHHLSDADLEFRLEEISKQLLAQQNTEQAAETPEKYH